MGRLAPLLLLAALVSCGGQPGAPTDGGSGIVGRVLLGPTCPVEIEASPCPAEPIQASVRVLAASPGNPPVITFRSAEDGSFRVPLEPGDYLLVGEVQGTGALFAKPVNVTVQRGSFVSVDVLLDTGIRGPG